jgi:hypothetical protein
MFDPLAERGEFDLEAEPLELASGKDHRKCEADADAFDHEHDRVVTVNE